MIYPILAAGFGFAFALAGALYPTNAPLLFILAALALISAVVFYQQSDKKSKSEKKEICDQVRLCIEEHLKPITEQPELERLKKIAKNRGLPLEECLLQFEKSTLFDQGLKAMLEKRYEDAVQIFSKNADSAREELAFTLFYLGNSLYFMCRYEKAAEKYKEALNHNPEDNSSWNNWGIVLSELGKYEEAIEKFKEALKHQPDDANAWYNWGIVLRKLDKHEEAIGKFKEALKHQPDDADAWTHWGLSLEELGKYEEAIGKFKEALKHQPDDIAAFFGWILVLKILGKTEAGDEKWEEALKHMPVRAREKILKDVPVRYVVKIAIKNLLGKIKRPRTSK